MDVIAKIDEFGKPAWITLMVLGFIVFWPIGLALLAYLIWSERMGCGHKRRNRKLGRWTWERPEGPPSGNRAFDEYRAETLRRLEEEQTEFKTFLDQLRFAKDKAEFDEFMAERRRRAAAGPETHGNGPPPSVPPQPGPA
jgi:hypothetical protein